MKYEQRSKEASCQPTKFASIISKSWLTTNTSRFEMENKATEATEYTQLSGRKLARKKLKNGKISTVWNYTIAK